MTLSRRFYFFYFDADENCLSVFFSFLQFYEINVFAQNEIFMVRALAAQIHSLTLGLIDGPFRQKKLVFSDLKILLLFFPDDRTLITAESSQNMTTR